MPNLDGTGPMSIGPRTGRGFGPCCLGMGWRRRQGDGRGMGRYFGMWSWPQSKQDQTKALTEYRKALEEELEDVRKTEEELGQEG
ncbi:DUF5320 domain-containing protein [Patescibacteria group bacterium]|nr:DUF5320 domain-containing protein [Patescibacteria group bacterium]MBU1868306.1 DUF5320 domain-containing protein [Patescibacteria group bacterium]